MSAFSLHYFIMQKDAERVWVISQ